MLKRKRTHNWTSRYMSSRSLGLILTGAFFSLWLSPAAHARTRYTVTDIGGGTATGLSNLGQVVGSFGNNHPFLYSNGQITDLSSLIFNSGAGRISSTVTGISKDGQQITGTSFGIYNVAFLISNGVVKNLSYPQGDPNQAARPGTYPYLMVNYDSTSYGQAVNDSGQVAGYAYPYYYYPQEHAFLFSNGLNEDIGTLAGKINGIDGMFSQAYGINERGETSVCPLPPPGPSMLFCTKMDRCKISMAQEISSAKLMPLTKVAKSLANIPRAVPLLTAPLSSGTETYMISAPWVASPASPKPSTTKVTLWAIH
jgi:probable HAF family extracellular repeat protein